MDESNLKRFSDFSITMTGPKAGFTRLHHACLENNEAEVNSLLNNDSVNVNAVAEDGTQPIHLACLLGHCKVLKNLIKAGANINAEITQVMFAKYVKDTNWCSDFGDKMSLLTFAIATHCRFNMLVSILMEHEANFEMISLQNKTILKYAIENNHFQVVYSIVFHKEYKKFINSRDNDGLLDIHYLLHPKRYRDYRFVEEEFNKYDKMKGKILMALITTGADIYGTVNGDKDTLLINMAAYRSSSEVLKKLLPCYRSLSGSKALYYATLPPGDPDKYLHPCLDIHDEELYRHNENMLERQRTDSKVLILKDLVNRRTFGLFVPEEEKNLMDTLYETDTDVTNIIDNYKQDFIEGELKNIMIMYGDQSISFYDFVLKNLKYKKLRLLVEDDTLKEALESIYFSPIGDDIYYFRCFLILRFRAAKRRVQLLDDLKKVPHLREAIPLPFECVIEIIEYLNNKDLEKFISAFSTTSSIN